MLRTAQISPQHPEDRRTPPIDNQRGVALIGVVLITAAIFALGIFGTKAAQVELGIAGNDLRSEQALALAEAGIHHVYALVKDAGKTDFATELTDGNGTGGALTSLGSIVTVRGDDYRFRPLGSQPDDGYYVRITDNFDETVGANDPTNDQDFEVTIVSRGRVGNAERIVHAGLKRDLAFPYAIFAREYMDLSGGMDTDSYDSRLGPYDPSTAGNNGDVRSNGNVDANPATVKGDATASGQVNVGSGTVTGTVTNDAPPLDFPSVSPCGPPYSNGAGISGSGTWSYDPATGKLDIRDTATLADGTYCFSSIKESAHGVLEVSGPVKVYVTGEVDATGDGINNTTQIPSNFLLFSSFVDPGEGIKITAQANTYLAVYAPDTGIKVNGGSDLFGALVGRTLDSAGNAALHYDEALKNDVPAGPPRLTSWAEARNF